MSNTAPKTLIRDFEYCQHRFRVAIVINSELGLLTDKMRHKLTLSYLGSRNFQKVVYSDTDNLLKEIELLEVMAKNWVDGELGISEEEQILQQLGFKRV